MSRKSISSIFNVLRTLPGGRSRTGIPGTNSVHAHQTDSSHKRRSSGREPLDFAGGGMGRARHPGALTVIIPGKASGSPLKGWIKKINKKEKLIWKESFPGAIPAAVFNKKNLSGGTREEEENGPKWMGPLRRAQASLSGEQWKNGG